MSPWWWLVLLCAGVWLAVSGVVDLMEWHGKRKLVRLQAMPGDIAATKPNRLIPGELIRAAVKFARDQDLAPDNPPLQIGEQCLLLGDGTAISRAGVMTVVDADSLSVVVAWDDGEQEERLPRVILNRYRPGPPSGGVETVKNPRMIA